MESFWATLLMLPALWASIIMDSEQLHACYEHMHIILLSHHICYLHQLTTFTPQETWDKNIPGYHFEPMGIISKWAQSRATTSESRTSKSQSRTSKSQSITSKSKLRTSNSKLITRKRLLNFSWYWHQREQLSLSQTRISQTIHEEYDSHDIRCSNELSFLLQSATPS